MLLTEGNLIITLLHNVVREKQKNIETTNVKIFFFKHNYKQAWLKITTHLENKVLCDTVIPSLHYTPLNIPLTTPNFLKLYLKLTVSIN